MSPSRLKGHLWALLCCIIWGTTFITTKTLLSALSPMEIMLFRFVTGYIALFAIDPHPTHRMPLRNELLCAGAGLCGVTLYYTLESVSLIYTSAASVSVITCTAPFFTGLLAGRFLKRERPNTAFYVGFVFSIVGVGVISFAGSDRSVELLGSVLALCAAAVWGVYSILVKKCEAFGLTTLRLTRRIFLYGVILLLPVAVPNFSPSREALTNVKTLLELLYLSIGASAVCFLGWNEAMRHLGAVSGSVYIYLIPVVTVVASFLFLREPITAASFTGMLLTLAGLILSESPLGRSRNHEEHQPSE